MTPRRLAREVALQILYGLDSESAPSPAEVERALRAFFDNLARREEDDDSAGPGAGVSPDYDRQLCETFVREVMAHRDELDETITATSRSWRIERMARVDRNILRLAIYELRYRPEIPIRVTLNEAIELAKRFGADESPAFVNGLLDSTVKSLDLHK